ncbi:Leucine-rich repeat [Trypanosoma melophagium]|uniref:Leucine-rich repeat n=1 Tax=Trypanosoma melophagium TaxID=715481 RepID=UPI00351A6699|nr:Leucine-rich repeat [Trypanosoma melophagium]
MITRLRDIFVCCASGGDDSVLTPKEAAAGAAVIAYEKELLRKKCVASLLRSCRVKSSVIPPPKWRKRYGKRVPIGPDGALSLCEHLLRQRTGEQANSIPHHSDRRITLDLHGLRIEDDGVRALVPLLSSDDRLMTLVLSDNNITDDGLGVLLEALAVSPKSIQRLFLSGNPVTPAGVRCVVEACVGGLLPSLHALSLSYPPNNSDENPEKSETSENGNENPQVALAAGLSRLLRGDGGPSLAALDVSVPIGEAAAAVLAAGVADAPRLAALRLRGCGMTAAGLRHIAGALAASRTLVALDISRQSDAVRQPQMSSASQRPLLPIIKALHTNHTLRTLIAYSIDVVDDDVEELCACVERSGNTALQCVHLTGVTSKPLAIKLENLLMCNAKRAINECSISSVKSSNPNGYITRSGVKKVSHNMRVSGLQTDEASFPALLTFGSATQRRKSQFKESVKPEGISSHKTVKLPAIGTNVFTSVLSLQCEDDDGGGSDNENEIRMLPAQCDLKSSMSAISLPSMRTLSYTFSPRESFGQPLYSARRSASKQKQGNSRTLRAA